MRVWVIVGVVSALGGACGAGRCGRGGAVRGLDVDRRQAAGPRRWTRRRRLFAKPGPCVATANDGDVSQLTFRAGAGLRQASRDQSRCHQSWRVRRRRLRHRVQRPVHRHHQWCRGRDHCGHVEGAFDAAGPRRRVHRRRRGDGPVRGQCRGFTDSVRQDHEHRQRPDEVLRLVRRRPGLQVPLTAPPATREAPGGVEVAGDR